MVREDTRGLVEYTSRESSEQNAWRQVLGSEITINPLPDYVTKHVEEKLSEIGFRSINYLPDLGLHEIALRKMGPEAYIRDIARRYPRWAAFEDLSFAQRSDASYSRNMMKWFWEEIRNRRIQFPQLPGLWMAIEDVEKPAYGDKYAKTSYTEILGFGDDRIGYSWRDIYKRIESTKFEVLSYLGLSQQPIELRFLEAIEYNLLANRGGWGKTNIYEWTNTEFREQAEPDPDVFQWWSMTESSDDPTHRLIAGNSLLGGAGRVTPYDQERSDKLIGFRCAIVFGVIEEQRSPGKSLPIDAISRKHCEVLGINSDDFDNLSGQEREKFIETSFKAMALRFHPDMGGTNEKMQEIIRAREQLKGLCC